MMFNFVVIIFVCVVAWYYSYDQTDAFEAAFTLASSSPQPSQLLLEAADDLCIEIEENLIEISYILNPELESTDATLYDHHLQSLQKQLEQLGDRIHASCFNQVDSPECIMIHNHPPILRLPYLFLSMIYNQRSHISKYLLSKPSLLMSSHHGNHHGSLDTEITPELLDSFTKSFIYQPLDLLLNIPAFSFLNFTSFPRKMSMEEERSSILDQYQGLSVLQWTVEVKLLSLSRCVLLLMCHVHIHIFSLFLSSVDMIVCICVLNRLDH